ncbi:hypothetical protein L1049_000137 [Liquidambar formosana]|uniref:Uncharacterized protein n=1 Tax=Liquidambar formosana TaxID=63359 RepID=A0AAP0N981_LIQFO
MRTIEKCDHHYCRQQHPNHKSHHTHYLFFIRPSAYIYGGMYVVAANVHRRPSLPPQALPTFLFLMGRSNFIIFEKGLAHQRTVNSTRPQIEIKPPRHPH